VAYTGSAWVRSSTAPLTVVLRFREVRDGVAVKTTSKSLTLSDTGWHALSVSHVAARSGSTLDLNVLSLSMRSSASFDVDDVAVVDGTTAATPSIGCTVNSRLVPSCGALWGIYNPIGSIPGATNWTTAITSMESKVGRRFDIVKRYHDFSNSGSSGAFPDSHERSLAGGGRIPFIAWVSKNFSTGADQRWADIAAGRYDASVIDPVARRLEDYGGKVFLDFDHEMDGRMRVNDGTPAQYVQAYRHIRARFNAIGADNVIFVWTTTGYLGNEAKIIASYPGDAYVDWIAYDPYNFGVCHDTPWKSFDATVDPFYDWLMSHGHADKPFMLGEYGSVPDPQDPYRRASWFRGQVAGMKAHPNIKAVIYYNSHGSCPPAISSSISNDAPALDAFGDAGRDSYFRVPR
jgi:beta-mannanase